MVLGATVMALAIGGTVAVTSASAETRQVVRPASVTTAWAKVSASGVLLASSGITGINHFGGGRYDVFTSGSVDSCALLGTINTNGGGDPGPGSSSILVGEVSSNTLFIRTATPSSAGSAAVDSDRPFSISIVC
ncbi:hypothetical protein GCM10009665_33100 [Kitasatospora nipponensis]|uniref:Uncharacterized protein n=1 Tax=Kitasatospora nipponensis TaxID=258049 RepID=A0ABN1W7X9_9ACTN